MEGKIRKIIPGANTANGSFNFFDNIIQDDINKIFCFKGSLDVYASGELFLCQKYTAKFVQCSRKV